MNKETLHEIEQAIGYNFADPTLLKQAFTHTSSVDSRHSSNERLEFLGDSILSVVICRRLFDKFPKYLEGDLTKIKSMLVSRRTCAKICRQLNLQQHLKIGKGMLANRAITSSLSAGLLEAIIAVIYFDGGMSAAEAFIDRNFGELISSADARQAHGNYKSLLQQYAQQELNATPRYVLLDEKGPDHDKCFELAAVIGDRHFQSAWGTNKKEAEQKAAYNALVELDKIKSTKDDED